ncbi:hypothetical protein H3C66_01330 [Patescibacteria group bacterium]|nr:hypothetical protein [Patescibacteria group bacterium]
MTEINTVQTPPTPQQVKVKNQKKLTQLETVSTRPLLVIQTVFPFRFFPCTISLDRQKLTISDTFFFFSKEVENYLAKDIVSVSTTEDLLFGSLSIVSGQRINKEVTITHLWKEDARRLRRMVEGMLIAAREGIDLMQISDQELIAKLEEIGAAKM